ncbi:MAG: hypothetical protein NVS1B14_08560 [Vulcanimicrobiaceae bacterium]
MIPIVPSRPARSYAESLERVQALKNLDDASILPEARTRLLDHGSPAPLAVVLLHGFTNHPGQYVQFAPLVHAQGANVLIPRLPEQGDRDRMTTRLARLGAVQLLESATEAVDIAQGLGQRVAVLGISTSGLLCAYFAQYRADVARSIPVNPVFAMLHVPSLLSHALARILVLAPNFFMWWDPRHKEAELPATGYPRFPTRALARTLSIGDRVARDALAIPLAAQSVVTVTNAKDPAVNNRATHAVTRAWRRLAPERVAAFAFTDLPVNHDILDPQNAEPRLDIVYPKLLEFLAGTPGQSQG